MITGLGVKRKSAVAGNGPLDEACAQLLLDLRATSPDLRSVVVTGCSGGVGATTIATALARAAHLVGLSRVLLVDAAPSPTGLSASLTPGNRQGLRQFQQGVTALPDLVKSYGPGIEFLPSGAGSGAVLPSEAQLAALSGQLPQTYDLVIWDGAPVTGSVEAKRLMMQVGKVLLVSETDRTRSAEVIAAIDHLRRLAVEPLAVIRNRAGRAPFGFGTTKST